MKKITKKVNTIVFDWDGTILDSMEYKKNNIIRSINLYKEISPNKIIELHNKYSGIPRKKLLQTIFLESTGDFLSDDLFQDISNEYTAMNLESSKNAEIFRDALSFLNRIRDKKNINIYISSSADKNEIIYSAKKNNIEYFFKEILGSAENFCKGKSHFNYILDREKISKDNIIFIGDDNHDYIIGRKNCIKTYQICRNNKKVNKEFQIVSLDEIEFDN